MRKDVHTFINIYFKQTPFWSNRRYNAAGVHSMMRIFMRSSNAVPINLTLYDWIQVAKARNPTLIRHRPDKMQCRYNAVNFLQIAYVRHPLARSGERGMGCLLGMIAEPKLSSFSKPKYVVQRGSHGHIHISKTSNHRNIIRSNGNFSKETRQRHPTTAEIFLDLLTLNFNIAHFIEIYLMHIFSS